MFEMSITLPIISNLVVLLLMVSFFLEIIKPINLKVIKKTILLSCFFYAFIFYTNTFRLGNLTQIIILLIFSLFSLYIFIQALVFRGKMQAIKEYTNNPLKLKYTFDDTIKRINHVILFLLTIVIGLNMLFIGSRDNYSIVGLICLVFVIVITFNHYEKGHITKTGRVDSEEIKTHLFTLMSLTLILSFMLFFTLLFVPFDSYVSNKFVLLPVFAFIVVLPPILISDHFLNRFRQTFLKNKKINEYFISNFLRYSASTIIITIILSDFVVVYATIKSQNIEGFAQWLAGFIPFITIMFLMSIKNFYLYKLESELIRIIDIS